MSQGTYWIVAGSTADQGREALYSVLKSRLLKTQLVADTAVFDVPTNLSYGSLDELFRLVDDTLPREDNFVETALRRIERQTLEIDSEAELRVIHQRNPIPVDQYLRRFAWDESKFSSKRLIRDIVQGIVKSVQALDDEVRGKMAAFNDLKQNATAATKKEGLNFIQRDLIDVLTPEVVGDHLFVDTEHLITVIAIVPRNHDKNWLNSYETLSQGVVPRSSFKFDPVDREGNTVWSLVVMRKDLEDTKQAGKSKRFTIRDFVFSEQAYKHKVEERTRLETEKSKQENYLSRVCLVAFSEIFISWVHLKAIRCFAEAAIRFGVPVSFAAFFLYVTNAGKERRLRKELDDIFTTKSIFGKEMYEPTKDATVEAEMGTEEFFPYVSLSLTPFQAFVQK